MPLPPSPTAPDFGVDLVCFPDLDMNTTISGTPGDPEADPAAFVQQVLFIRWSTPPYDPNTPGTGLFYDPTWLSVDVTALVNESLAPTTLNRWQAQLASVAQQDDIIQSCSVTLTPVGTASQPSLSIAGRVQTAQGPFTLTGTVDQLTGLQIVATPDK